VLANRTEFLGEHQKRSLKGILGVLRVLQDSPANAIDHRAVTMHDGLERRRVALRERSFHELTIGLLTQQLGVHSAGKATQNVDQSCRRHAHSPKPRFVSLIVVVRADA
jgi:hypothetical protein